MHVYRMISYSIEICYHTAHEDLPAPRLERHIQKRVIAVAAWTRVPTRNMSVRPMLTFFPINMPVNPIRTDTNPSAAK